MKDEQEEVRVLPRVMTLLSAAVGEFYQAGACQSVKSRPQLGGGG